MNYAAASLYSLAMCLSEEYPILPKFLPTLVTPFFKASIAATQTLLSVKKIKYENPLWNIAKTSKSARKTCPPLSRLMPYL